MAVAFLVLMSLVLLFFSIIFIRGSFSSWIGYLTIAFVVLLATAAAIWRYRFYFNIPPQLFYLFTFLMGIVLLRHALKG